MGNNIVNSPVPELSSTPFTPTRSEGSQPRASEGRHERKLVPSRPQAGEGCASVCRHPERDAIEEAFLHWQSPTEIAI